MEDVIKKKLCNFYINKSKNCMKFKIEMQKGVSVYMCENYKHKQGETKKYIDNIRYTFYDEIGNYIAIVRKDTNENTVAELKQMFDEVRYKE